MNCTRRTRIMAAGLMIAVSSASLVTAAPAERRPAPGPGVGEAAPAVEAPEVTMPAVTAPGGAAAGVAAPKAATRRIASPTGTPAASHPQAVRGDQVRIEGKLYSPQALFIVSRPVEQFARDSVVPHTLVLAPTTAFLPYRVRLPAFRDSLDRH
jgi:hypothetical protein